MKKIIDIFIFAFCFLTIQTNGQTLTNETTLLTEQTKKFLSKPFDVYVFKTKKKDSNSSGGGVQTYFYKPSKGVYWRFMLFRLGAGYVGEIPSNDFPTAEFVEIFTFQPPGKYQNKYTNPDETLIQYVGRCNDVDLPEMAFVGLDTTKIKKKLGPCILRKKDCFIYFHTNNLLTLRIKEGRVRWVKYTRLNFNVTVNNIPDDLLSDVSDQN